MSHRLALAFLLALVTTSFPPGVLAGDPAPPAAPPAPVAPSTGGAAATAAAAMGELDPARLEAHVRTLASPEYGGRGSPQDREKTWKFVADALVAAGVRPVPGASSLLAPFPAKEPNPAGTNVAGWIEGKDAKEYVVVSAHFDHLARKGEEWFPGADDNASGTAALIEIARALAKGPKPARSVLVLGFDLEESNCVGSRAYAANPAVPLERCAAFTTMDMMGRSVGDLFPGLLFVMGAERAAALGTTMASLPRPSGVVIRELGMDFNQLGWSDYVPFEERKVPCLFFTSGACRDYHRPTDVADKLDFPSLHARAATVLVALRLLAALPTRPVWEEAPAPRLVEIETLHALVEEAGRHEEEMKIPEGIRTMRKGFEANLAATLARGTVTVAERTAARNLALMLLRGLSAMR